MANCDNTLNPWMQDALEEFKSHFSDQALRERYWEAHEKDSKLSWRDFVYEGALREKLTDPVLGTRIADTDLPDNIKEAFYDAYIDWIANLMQFSEQNLRRLKGLSGDDVELVVHFLSERQICLRSYNYSPIIVVLEEQIRERQRNTYD